MRLGQHIKLLEENQIEGTAIKLSHCQKISLICIGTSIKIILEIKIFHLGPMN